MTQGLFNQWRGGIAAHPPHIIPSKKSAGEVLALIFWDQDGQTINAEYYSSVLVHLNDILKGKLRISSPTLPCSCTTMPRVTGHLKPRRTWPNWAFHIWITHSFLRIWPYRFSICPLDWKNDWKVAIFLPTRRSFLPRKTLWTRKILYIFFF
jgi:hypothetical protein